MSEVVVIVEGLTEKIFIKDMITPYLAQKGIYVTPIEVSKPGQKGGDIRFARVKRDLELHLKQRHDTFVTLFVDYYGIRNDWPGIDAAREKKLPAQIADVVNKATMDAVQSLFMETDPVRRFIPFVAVHEFETLLFSDAGILAAELGVRPEMVEAILTECGEPEKINNSSETAPSKRLEALNVRFKKTSTGIAIARAVGLSKMRAACPLFDAWVTTLENLRGNSDAA
ncbi:MAG: DUF4276 family protein [Fibrobacterota bacterium]|nr:MAG: DUF4276 family protein [Fibrobacterota bacterium]